MEPRTDIIHHGTCGDFAIRKGKWKYIDCSHSGGWSLEADEVPEDAPSAQLYDMSRNPGELVNLINLEVAVADYLKSLLASRVK